MIISQIEPIFNGRSPATGVKKGEKLANKRIYLHSNNFRIMSTVLLVLLFSNFVKNTRHNPAMSTFFALL